MAVKYGSGFSRRPLGGRAEGSVLINQRGGIYTAELDLQDATEFFIDQFSGTMRADKIRLADIPIPSVALSPNTQLIRGHSNILGSRNSSAAVYTIYTIDSESSQWSIHIGREGLKQVAEPATTRLTEPRPGVLGRLRKFLT